MTRIIPFVFICSLALASGAAANFPDLALSIIEIAPEAIDATIIIVPDGSGARFDEAIAPNGDIVDARITVTLIDQDTDVVVGYPAEDLWLETTDGGLAACAGGTIANQPSNIHGQTYWLLPLQAGGCTVGEMVQVMVSGMPIAGALDLVFKSPDINGDLVVDLVDIVSFTQTLGGADSCTDYNGDGVVNLTDIVYFAGGIGANCP